MLVETDGAGNRQIAHYGGDNGTTSKYRKGTLYFYNNTMVSYRTDRTTLFRLSTNEERADVRNNVFYVTAAGTTLSLLDETGILILTHNWFKPGRVATFGTLAGTINDDGTSIVGSSPGFRDEAGQDFRLRGPVGGANAGTGACAGGAAGAGVARQYVKHQTSEPRPNDGVLDLGAFEQTDGQLPNLVISTGSLPGGTVGTAYGAFVSATGGLAPYAWTIVAGSLPAGPLAQPRQRRDLRNASRGGLVSIYGSSDRRADACRRRHRGALDLGGRGAGAESAVDHHHQPAERAAQQELQPDVDRHRRHHAVHLEPRGRQPAAGTVAEHQHRRHQRARDHARPVFLHDAGQRQPADPDTATKALAITVTR